MADFDGRQAAYLTIANEYKRRIKAGDLKPGQQLPTQAEISAKRGVSRTVARQAMSRLIEDGYVYSHQGKGHFVVNDLSEAKEDQRSAEYTQINDTLTAVLQDVRSLGERLDELERLVRQQSPER